MHRFIEVLMALTLLPLICLILLICSFFMVFFQGGPVFFRSERVGKNQQIFTIFKLRTMSVCSPLIPTSHENSSLYVTKLGRFLRSTSLDELPQILNILTGSMTFVGPRPCLASEHTLIELREYKSIFSIKPGVTGLAQVRGRDKNSIRNKVRYESFYLNNKSFLFNTKLIIMTLVSVLKSSNISH